MKVLSIILVSILLFCITYARFTWYINPNINNEPVIVKIPRLKELQKGSYQQDAGKSIINERVIQGRSIIVFWFAFFIIDGMIIVSFIRERRWIYLFGATYTGITVLSIIFLTINRFLSNDPVTFSLYAILKNFLLSPFYIFVFIIFVKYFNKIVQ